MTVGTGGFNEKMAEEVARFCAKSSKLFKVQRKLKK